MAIMPTLLSFERMVVGDGDGTTSQPPNHALTSDLATPPSQEEALYQAKWVVRQDILVILHM